MYTTFPVMYLRKQTRKTFFGLQILILYAISHILMQKFKHEIKKKNYEYLLIKVILPPAVKDESPCIVGGAIAIYATSCKMSVFFALDMTIGPRVSTSGPTCRVRKNSHFATSFIQDFF
jgi:hypothetical protein